MTPRLRCASNRIGRIRPVGVSVGGSAGLALPYTSPPRPNLSLSLRNWSYSGSGHATIIKLKYGNSHSKKKEHTECVPSVGPVYSAMMAELLFHSFEERQ